MTSILFARRLSRLLGALTLATAVTGCGLESQDIPAVVGPSEFGLALTMSATPDVMSRDGSSMSVVTLTVRNPQGQPVAGQRVTLGLSPSNGGTLSAGEVVTGPDGRATFEVMAPPSSSNATSVSVVATPVGANADNAAPRSISIRLLGAAPPSPSFTVTPSAPELLQLVTFDASATTFNGAPCGDDCTYIWRFGNEQNATGRVVTYRFQSASTYAVELTVTSPSGAAAVTTQNVVVSTGTLTPVITLSPTNPKAAVDDVIFDGRSSTATGGATIVDYQWDFGDGDVASGARVSNTFPSARSYVVRLTVRDSFGRTATTTAAVTVAQ